MSAKPSRVDLSRLVKVETNVLNVWIDLLGGDIVRVELVQYPQSMDEGSPPIHLLTRSSDQIYLAQSGLIGDGPDSGDSRPIYKVERNGLVFRDEEGELVLTTDHNGLVIKKIFAFNPDDYLINVGYEVKNISSENFVAGMFAQIKRDSKLPQRDESLFFAPNPYLGGATTTDETRYEKITFEDVDEGKKSFSKQGGWIGFLQHYFLTAWIPQEKELNRFESLRSADDTYIFRTIGSTKQIAPLETGRWSSRFYAGPKNQIALAEISENLNMTVDYGFLWWIAEPLFSVLNYFHEVTGNWGAAIILLTVFVKAALFWFSHKGYHSMANLRRVAPAMKRLQERYSNDREKLSKEMMALYQKGRRQSTWGLFANASANANLFSSVLGAARVSRIAPHPIYPLDRRSISNGSVFCAASAHGSKHLSNASVKPSSWRSNAAENYENNASDVHRVVFVFPSGARPILVGQQFNLDSPSNICL